MLKRTLEIFVDKPKEIQQFGIKINYVNGNETFGNVVCFEKNNLQISLGSVNKKKVAILIFNLFKKIQLF